MNSTTLRRLRPLLSACLLLASLVALHAANWQTLLLQLTAPEWAAHGLGSHSMACRMVRW